MLKTETNIYYNSLGNKIIKSKESIIRNAWKQELVKQNYNTLATLQPPMRNRYMMDDRLKHFSEHQRIDGLFYSVEYNADKKSGYHIHLMFKDLCNISKEKKECTSEHLAWALDLNKSQIQYYKAINSKSAVSGYVLKNMKADQIHYNFY